MALVRAIPLKDFRATALSTSDVSTGYQFGPLTTGQKLYGALHLLSGYNSTNRVLSMVIQSATDSGFSPPANRITFTRSTAQGAEWGTPAENLSTEHSWWRASWTMATDAPATTGGTWTGLVHFGIK